jgi:hypothetical protein
MKQNSYLVEVGHLCDMDKVDKSNVLDLLSDRIEGLVHRHALAVPVMAESNKGDAIFF